MGHANVTTGEAPAASLLRRLARGGLISLPIYVLGVGISYVSQLVLARILGAHEFGLYAYAMAIVTVLAYCTALGLDAALMRFVPSYTRQSEWGAVAGVIRYAETASLSVGLAVAVCGAFLLFVPGVLGAPDYRPSLLLALVLGPIMALTLIRSAVARSFGDAAAAVAADRFARDGGLLLLIAAWLGFASVPLTASLALFGTVLSALAALALVTRALRRRQPPDLHRHPPVFDRPAWRRASFPFLVIVAAEALMNRAGSLVFGAAGQATEVGVFALCWSLAMLVTLPKSAINTLFIPIIAELHASADVTKLRHVVSVSALWMFGGALGLGLAVALASEWLLAFYGPAFSGAGTAIRIMIVGNVVVAALGSQLHLLTMTGRESKAAWLAALGTAVSFGASVLLIPSFGLNGAAWASAGALLIWNAAMACVLWMDLRLLPGVFASLPGRPPSEPDDAGPRSPRPQWTFSRRSLAGRARAISDAG